MSDGAVVLTWKIIKAARMEGTADTHQANRHDLMSSMFVVCICVRRCPQVRRVFGIRLQDYVLDLLMLYDDI